MTADYRELTRTLARSNDDVYPVANVAALVRANTFGAPFSPGLGGKGLTLRDTTELVLAIAEACPSTALLAAMPLGLAGVVTAGVSVAPRDHAAAAQAQLESIAADYRRGLIYAACNSEKGAGGSLAATKTVARKTSAGDFVIDGEKILASFGRQADVFFSTAKTSAEDLPGCGIVEFFLLPSKTSGVAIQNDWNGFGMRGTESHTVRYREARASGILGYPNFLETARPLEIWFALFAAIPLGCAASILRALATPSPASPALRLRLSEARMRFEAARAYLLEVAADFRPGSSASYRAKMLRMKTYVTQEATRLSAELFALAGGRAYIRGGALSGALADAFAGTALRPPLALALDSLVEGFSFEDFDGDATAP